MRLLRIVLLAIVVLGLLVPAAHAERPATADEEAAVATAWGTSPDCANVIVSELDATWAVLTLVNLDESCAMGDGFSAFHLANGAWTRHGDGSWTPEYSCAAWDGMPLPVQADLGFCTMPYPKPPTGKSWAAHLLRALPSANETTSPAYARTKFTHWIAVGRTGCNARYFVLWQETLRRPKPRCSATTGRWFSAYDGLTLTRAGQLDIDHMIPLAEAWRSGAATKWDAATRKRFANDVSYPHSLIAVSASSNRSKGDKDPSEWMPTVEGFHCAYVVRWIAVKHRWKLAVDPAERTKLDDILRDCDRAKTLIPTPTAAKITNVKPTPKPPSNDSGSGGSGCHPSYTGACLKQGAGDYDCEGGSGNGPNYTGPVTVVGPDEFDLDADGDGVGCEG